MLFVNDKAPTPVFVSVEMLLPMTLAIWLMASVLLTVKVALVLALTLAKAFDMLTPLPVKVSEAAPKVRLPL